MLLASDLMFDAAHESSSASKWLLKSEGDLLKVLNADDGSLLKSQPRADKNGTIVIRGTADDEVSTRMKASGRFTRAVVRVKKIFVRACFHFMFLKRKSGAALSIPQNKASPPTNRMER